MEGSIQLNLRLLDNKTGNVIWNEILAGSCLKSGLQIDHEGHRKEVAEATLRDAINKLAASVTFKNAVQNYPAQ